MNPIVRYFLPSQVRGVYRFEETYGTIDRADHTLILSKANFGSSRFL